MAALMRRTAQAAAVLLCIQLALTQPITRDTRMSAHISARDEAITDVASLFLRSMFTPPSSAWRDCVTPRFAMLLAHAPSARHASPPIQTLDVDVLIETEQRARVAATATFVDRGNTVAAALVLDLVSTDNLWRVDRVVAS